MTHNPTHLRDNAIDQPSAAPITPVMVTLPPAAKPSDKQRVEELGRIILAYSEVTEKLQASHLELQQTVVKLTQEIGDKNRQLERRKRLAALGEMAAGMAHEIRNPLGGIQLYASMLAGDVADRPQAAQLVSKISGGVRRLEALVSQVLRFTRDLRVDLVDTDLVPVIHEAVELAHGHSGAAALTLDVTVPSTCPLPADGLLLGQALLNLIINAIDAAGPSGRVLVTCVDIESAVRITVADTGPGIPAEHADQIFNPFFTTKDEGTGLGLPIVHRIVEAHDGTITLRKSPLGGAEFEILLPRRAARNPGLTSGATGAAPRIQNPGCIPEAATSSGGPNLNPGFISGASGVDPRIQSPGCIPGADTSIPATGSATPLPAGEAGSTSVELGEGRATPHPRANSPRASRGPVTDHPS